MSRFLEWCSTVAEGGNGDAAMHIVTIVLTLLPLAMIAAFVVVYRARARQMQAGGNR